MALGWPLSLIARRAVLLAVRIGVTQPDLPTRSLTTYTVLPSGVIAIAARKPWIFDGRQGGVGGGTDRCHRATTIGHIGGLAVRGDREQPWPPFRVPRRRPSAVGTSSTPA